MSDERALDKIGKLLAQAEGTDNEHEAEAFVTRAQELATAWAVDLETARARQASRRLKGVEEAFEQRKLAVGEKGRRGNRHLVTLFLVVAQVNDVLVNVASDSTFVLGFGHPADLDVVEQLWASLATQMAAAAARRMRAGEHAAQRTPAVTWRLSFYDGWIGVVQQRLRAARDNVVTARPATDGSPSAALVLRDKSERVKAFHDSASQARGSWRGAQEGRRTAGRAWAAGQQDGRTARLGHSEVAPQRALGAARRS